MSIYNYDNQIIAEQLTPPVLRTTKFLQWLYVITNPIYRIYKNVFSNYKDGDVSSPYDPTVTYNIFNTVVFTDNSVYECIVNGTVGIDCLNTNNWNKINDTYIGISERIYYTSQIITLEYILNKHFNNIGATNQIYLINNSISSTYFLMGTSGIYSSKMPRNGALSSTFMGLTPSYPIQYNMTIMFPIALFTSLDPSSSNQNLIVRNLVNKYILAGITYNIQTY